VGVPRLKKASGPGVSPEAAGAYTGRARSRAKTHYGLRVSELVMESRRTKCGRDDGDADHGREIVAGDPEHLRDTAMLVVFTTVRR